MHNTHIHGPDTELQKRYINSEVFEFKNIAEAKPKYYHSSIQGPASALGCEVLDCCSRGGLPSLFSDLGLTTGPHPLVTAVTKPWQLCTQKGYTSKAWATKSQQD
jgi:hypothetical protein